ncbi:MAG TPA: hypothetical protein VN249_09500, partial [Prolixibacteraceae bacterium]|nr:hypothetical protein [Prolixibacteraceae bacterium]
ALNPRWLMIGDGTMNMVQPSASPVAAVVSNAAAADYANTAAAAADPENAANTAAAANASNATVFADDDVAEVVDANSATDATAAVPEVRDNERVQVAQKFLQKDREAENSVLNQTTPPSGGSEGGENASLQSNPTSPQAPIPSKGKEIEQVLFFYTDKTFSIYRPS